jgi:hypothetical protein
VRLDVQHLGPRDEPGDPAELDGDAVLAARAVAAPAGLDDTAHRLRQSVLADGLEDVVDRVELERLDRVVVVRGDEDDWWRGLEAGQHLGQLEAVEAGHPDVGEDRVDAALLQHAQGLGGVVGRGDVPDPSVVLEQPGELVERGTLVVDDEDAEGGAVHWCTPGAYLGTRTITRVPAPGAVSTTSP